MSKSKHLESSVSCWAKTSMKSYSLQTEVTGLNLFSFIFNIVDSSLLSALYITLALCSYHSSSSQVTTKKGPSERTVNELHYYYFLSWPLGALPATRCQGPAGVLSGTSLGFLSGQYCSILLSTQMPLMENMFFRNGKYLR